MAINFKGEKIKEPEDNIKYSEKNLKDKKLMVLIMSQMK